VAVPPEEDVRLVPLQSVSARHGRLERGPLVKEQHLHASAAAPSEKEHGHQNAFESESSFGA
jgi:hypothetical protein